MHSIYFNLGEKKYYKYCKAAIGGEKRKEVTYEKLLRNYIFVPIAVETFGSWGPRGLKFIKEIGRKIQGKTGNKNATSHIIQAISMTVQRGNTISIMGTLAQWEVYIG